MPAPEGILTAEERDSNRKGSDSVKIGLTDRERELLAAEEIVFDPDRDHTDEEVLELLEKIYDAEIKYSSFPPDDRRAAEEAVNYAHMADRIQALIPEK